MATNVPIDELTREIHEKGKSLNRNMKFRKYYMNAKDYEDIIRDDEEMRGKEQWEKIVI